MRRGSHHRCQGCAFPKLKALLHCGRFSVSCLQAPCTIIPSSGSAFTCDQCGLQLTAPVPVSAALSACTRRQRRTCARTVAMRRRSGLGSSRRRYLRVRPGGVEVSVFAFGLHLLRLLLLLVVERHHLLKGVKRRESKSPVTRHLLRLFVHDGLARGRPSSGLLQLGHYLFWRRREADA